MLLLEMCLRAIVVFLVVRGTLGNSCAHSPYSMSSGCAGYHAAGMAANRVDPFNPLVMYVNGTRYEIVPRTIDYGGGKVTVYRMPVGISANRVIDRWLEVLDYFMKDEVEQKMREYLSLDEGEEYRFHLRVYPENDIQLLQSAYRVEIVMRVRLKRSRGFFLYELDRADGEYTSSTLLVGITGSDMLVFDGLRKDQIEEFMKKREE